jgi:uncharacterized protein (DUF983 family)
MPDQNLPTVAQSALRGIACRCPRCGRGKLYSGFLTLRPNCEACGLDYAFIDSGDGPAVLPMRSMKSLLIALQFHHKAAEGRLIDREPK